MINVLFVCLGNICRSPMAEGIFKHLVEQEGLSDQIHVDSVGTSGYHVGDPAHRGTRRVLADHGIKSESTSRQITRTDLIDSHYIVAMDGSNLSDVRRLARDSSIDDKLYLLLDFAENADVRDVPDPYYHNNFEEVYLLVEDGCEGLLSYICEQEGI